MKTARRLYIYLACFVALQAAAWALIALLRGLVAGAASPDSTAFQVAVIVICLPAFAGHWLWAGRLVAGEPGERGAVLRWVYLYGAQAAFLAPIAANARGLARNLVGTWLGSPGRGPLVADEFGHLAPGEPLAAELPNQLAAIAVLGLLLAYHWQRARRERAAEPGPDAAAVRRLYLLATAAVAGAAATLGAARVLRFLLFPSALGSARDFLPDEVSRLIVGGAVWAVAWWTIQGLRGAGDTEARAGLRYAYVLLAVVAGALTVVANVALVLTGVFRQVLGVPAGGDLSGPLPMIVMAGLVWAYHAWSLGREPAVGDDGRRAGVRRTYVYVVAAIGLAAAGAGLGNLLAVLLQVAAESPWGFGPAEREKLAWSAAVFVAGLPVWAWAWRTAQLWLVAPTDAALAERTSTARRAYLYAVMLATGLAAVSGAVYLVYRPLAGLLGASPPDDVALKIGRAMAALAVGGGLWLYHARTLRLDSRADRRARGDRLTAMLPVLVATGDGRFAQAVIEGLARELPDVALRPMAISPEAAEALGVAAAGPEAAADLSGAGLVVGTSEAAIPGYFRSPELASAVAASAALKLLVPVAGAGVTWAGVDDLPPEAAARQAIAALLQLAAGEPVRPERPVSGLGVVGLAGALAVALLLVLCLIIFVIFGGFVL